jgi:hypothetical protein
MLTLLLLSLSVSAQQLLLVPKADVMSMFNLDTFSVEHNLETVASFSDFSIYSTSVENFNVFSTTLTELFDIEEDQVINVNNEVYPLPTFNLEKLLQEYTLNHNLDHYIYLKDVLESEQRPFQWHLERIVKHSLKDTDHWSYNLKGSCHRNPNVTIHTYVIDTGIDTKHPEFEGRAEWLANFADNVDTDGNSHGTHCSGLVGSKSYGSCRDAKLFGIKVLDASGSGTLSGVIKGIEFAYKRHQDLSKTVKNLRSIASMSLGGGFSLAINMAVESVLKSNTFYFAVAAGNENSDSCQTSPASAKGVMTVMAMGNDDSRAYFSNFGKCADMYSPGVNILSTVPDGETAVYSGTSMSTPILAGVMNHYLDMYPDMNMAQLKKKMIQDSTSDTISRNPANTPNKLVYLRR